MELQEVWLTLQQVCKCHTRQEVVSSIETRSSTGQCLVRQLLALVDLAEQVLETEDQEAQEALEVMAPVTVTAQAQAMQAVLTTQVTQAAEEAALTMQQKYTDREQITL